MYCCLRMVFRWFSVEFTTPKFNIAPEKLPSQKEHSLPTILLQGQNLSNFRNVKLVFSDLISATLGFWSKIRPYQKLIPDKQKNISKQLFPPKTKNWVFPKIGVPPKHPKMIIFSRKPMVVGYHHLWKHPTGTLQICWWMTKSRQLLP